MDVQTSLSALGILRYGSHCLGPSPTSLSAQYKLGFAIFLAILFLYLVSLRLKHRHKGQLSQFETAGDALIKSGVVLRETRPDDMPQKFQNRYII